LRTKAAIVAGIGIAAAGAAAWLFPRATPVIALRPSLTREAALARADSFFQTHSLTPAAARTAVSFESDDSLRTFVELGGGGLDSLNALIRGDDVAPFTWSVRAFVPGDPREAFVDFAPDGRIIGFERKLAESDRRPTVSADSGRRLAEQVLDTWIDDRANRWKLVASSYETQKVSGRLDRTYTFERVDRRIGDAPIRADAVIAGDTPSQLLSYVEIPQSFQRRYAGMRAWNDLLALLATLSLLAISVAGAAVLVHYNREGRVRWRQPMVVGAAIGALFLAAALNQIPGSWFSYDTAMSPTTFMATTVLFALLTGVSTAALVGVTRAAAEAVTRHAFPDHLDWWKLWRYRGTREVASRVGGGYVVAALALAYVGVFYLAARKLLGWWAPAELLDDPNQIATPLPWLGGIALSAQAAVWEEALSRALPLSLLALWAGRRPTRRWWMVAGVIGSALVFGFAHAGYASWPPYSRGIEIFLDACFWAFLFLKFGLLVTVVAHFVYDALLFGLFAAAGTTAAYRITATVILVALLGPALVVIWRAARQRGFTSAPEDARFSAWTPLERDKPIQPVQPRPAGAFTPRARRLAVAAAMAGLVAAVALPPEPTEGPQFTASRGRILQTADSVLRARAVDPAGWTRLATIDSHTREQWERFARQHRISAEARQKVESNRTWWAVRYVHTAGGPAERAEEWHVRLLPNGRPLDVSHIVPDSAHRRNADSAAVRRIAAEALVRERIDTSTLEETEFRETPRPARRDVRVTYADTEIKLPAGASARVAVDIAGDEPLSVWRWVDLPETFLRADRERQTNRMVIAAVSVLLLLGIVVGGAVVVRRRLPVAVHDGTLARGARLWLIGGLLILETIDHLNSLPSQLYSYDTAKPWSTFVGTTALGFVGPVILTLMLGGLWLVLQSLRRRVGIPMLADKPSRSAAAEILIAGLGIAGVAYAAGRLDALMSSDSTRAPPSSALDQVIPWLAGVVGTPASAIVTVAAVAIPILVVAGLTRRWSQRALLGTVIFVLSAISVWAFESQGEVHPAEVPLAIAGFVLTVAALIAWGSRSAWSWLVAALCFQVLSGVHEVLYGSEWQARIAGALSVALAAGLTALIVRRSASV